jgi:hypothetical protein
LAPLYDPDYPKLADIIVGGEVLELSEHVVLLFEGGNLAVKTVFNYRLQREHRLIECAFGLPSNK